jgi:hypothetical protein
VDIASRADLGQWQFTSAKFCCPPNARETKRESPEARSGYRITRLRGIQGWPACEDSDRTRAVQRWRIPQDVDAERERTSISRIPLNSNINSLYLSLNSFSSRPFYSFSSKYSFMTNYRKFLFFFCTMLDRSNISFSLLWILLFTSKSDIYTWGKAAQLQQRPRRRTNRYNCPYLRNHYCSEFVWNLWAHIVCGTQVDAKDPLTHDIATAFVCYLNTSTFRVPEELLFKFLRYFFNKLFAALASRHSSYPVVQIDWNEGKLNVWFIDLIWTKSLLLRNILKPDTVRALNN